MKAEMIEFLIRLSLIWSALLLFYQRIFAKNDNWRLQRAFLIGAYLMGWIIPLLPTLLYSSSTIPVFTPTIGGIVTISVASPETASPQEGLQYWNFYAAIPALYLLGVFWQVLSLLVQYFRLLYWKQSGRRSSYRGFPVIYHEKINAPFAGLGIIFLPNKTAPAMIDMICLHESIHLKNKHLQERMPLVLGNIFLWFHPLQWLFLRRQEMVQEYEVDEEVIRAFSPTSYGKLLIQSSMAPSGWHPKLYSSPLKKRIDMMCKKKNHRGWRKGHSFFLILLLGFLLVNCSDLVKSIEFSDPVTLDINAVDQKPVLDVGEERYKEMPDPDRIFLEEVYRTVLYPAVARNNGVTGTYKASFNINESGHMEELVVKPVDLEETDRRLRIVVIGYGNNRAEKNVDDKKEGNEALLKEVERTLSDLPNWLPARHEGKAVPVRMELYFQYRLE